MKLWEQDKRLECGRLGCEVVAASTTEKWKWKWEWKMEHSIPHRDSHH